MVVDRRRLLQLIVGTSLVGCGSDPTPAACGADGAGEGLKYCLVERKEITLVRTADLAVGEVALFALDDHSSAIVARDGAGFYALSGTCPHACCTVALCGGKACAVPLISPTDCAPAVRAPLSRSGAAFLCPCHGSQFAADGSVLTGPARTRLPSVALRLEGRNLVVDLSTPVAPEARVAPT